MQLELWGLDYFDLFLVHFPIALAYVDPKHRYPPDWWGDDGKTVNLRMFSLSHSLPRRRRTDLCH
jgi:D-xylose reductase